jgi:hypothetical protein
MYCDMETDWGWWTRIRKWENWPWYTDLKTINQTKPIKWNELMVLYTRYWKIRTYTWWIRQDFDMTWKKFWIYYKKFKTKQWDLNWICWEHTTISDLVSQVTWWTRWNCNRDCPRINWDPNASCDDSQEYIDMELDDFWKPSWKYMSWFTSDPCITDWLKWWVRNISWTSMWTVHHRIDNTTSLFDLWWTSSPRCYNVVRDIGWIQARLNEETNPNWYRHQMFSWVSINNYIQWFQTNEVYVR